MAIRSFSAASGLTFSMAARKWGWKSVTGAVVRTKELTGWP